MPRVRHSRAIDLSAVTDPAHREVVQDALNRFDFPLGRVRRLTGRKVPVAVSDLSRFAAALDEYGHGHIDELGAHGHLLGLPAGEEGARRAPLGLYWLPTTAHPAGRIELHAGIMGDRALAQEVLIAELAHAIDYGAITPEQRGQLNALFEHPGGSHGGHVHDARPIGPDEWFEAHAGGYWGWPGERWMGLAMAAYAPALPRPLEARQPWTHGYDEADVRAARRILRRP